MNYIKKIALSTVESRLDKDLNKNFISLGFDSSEHSTGIALIRTTGTYLIIEKLDKIIIPKEVQGTDAVDVFTDKLEDFKKTINDKMDKTSIEDCFIGLNPKTGIW